MIHSLVIGLTLAVASGSDFSQFFFGSSIEYILTNVIFVASLTTAIIFHQLFEGLSLGIRIAALPPPMNANDGFHDENSRTSSSCVSASVNQRVLNGQRFLWPSTTYLGVRKWWLSRLKHLKDLYWLKPTLSFLFAVTTPSGMALGILLFGPRRKTSTGKFDFLLSRMAQLSFLLGQVLCC